MGEPLVGRSLKREIDSTDITSPRFRRDPHPFYARLRAEAPVIRIRWMLGTRPWMVVRYDDVLTVLKDPRFSKDFLQSIPVLPKRLRALSRNLLNLDPPDHTRLRTLVSKAFTLRAVERLRESLEVLCENLLAQAARHRSLELVAEYALQVPLTVIGDLLGIPAAARREFSSWSKQVAKGDTGRVIDVVRAQVNLWRFNRYFRKFVAIRRVAPQDDMVSALVEAEEQGDKLSEEELISLIALLLFAGYGTTVNLIATGALTLMQHPEQRSVLQARPELIEPAVEELLRYTSPADFATPRIAREDVTLSGVTIPRGSVVLAAIGSANRDESQFHDPNRLDITRSPNRHIAFGYGTHFCLGASLARLEGQIALRALFRRFPDLRPAQPPDEISWRRGLMFRGLEKLPAIWA
jgi:cytochrome P450